MLSVDQARTQILEKAHIDLGVERIPLLEALGRRLAEDIFSPIDVPPADNSAMDGIAVNSKDCVEGLNQLELSQRIAAGHAPQPLVPGTAVRIFTGAEVPKGADAVEIQENCTFDGTSVRFEGKLSTEKNIRKRGQDIGAGSLVLHKGDFLRSQELGLLASIGIQQIPVYKKIRVGVLSTGDELAEPGQPLASGQIYNSNRYTLGAMIVESGCEFVDLGKIEDKLDIITERLKSASVEVDVLVSSGGVSVGEEDHIKPAVEACGSLSLWKIALKPGKPLAVGEVLGTPFFGLPGNPVSSFATFLLFVKPFLAQAAGANPNPLDWFRVPVNFSRNEVSREEYIRVRLVEGQAELFPNQSSGVLSSLSWSTGLIRQKIGETIDQGSDADYLPFTSF